MGGFTMAAFDETALKRLEALVSKSRSGSKLPATEALELKELKLLKSAAELAKGRAELATARRKMDDREKYRIGGIAIAAGLSSWTDAELKDGFAKLAASGPEQRSSLDRTAHADSGNVPHLPNQANGESEPARLF
jgi:hypothetical protein